MDGLVQRLELSGQKIIGDGQFSDLGVKVPDCALVDLGWLLAAALENIGRSFEQGIFSLVDHGRMHAISCRQLSRSHLALQGFQRDARLECSVWFLRFDISDLLVLGDQQTSDRSFRQRPIFGE